MRIGVIPRARQSVRRESAHLTGIFPAGFRNPVFGRNVRFKVDGPDQQSWFSRLNRYPSPSTRSGPFGVRPTFFVGAGYCIRNRRQVADSNKVFLIGLDLDQRFGVAAEDGSNQKGKRACNSENWQRRRLYSAYWQAAATTWANRPCLAARRGQALPQCLTATSRLARWSVQPVMSPIATATRTAADPNLKHSSGLPDALNHAAPDFCRGGVFVVPARRTRGQGTGRTE